MSSLHDMLQTIDSFHIHPKNKLVLYLCYVLSKPSWHLTVKDLSKRWICEYLDNIVIKYVHQWPDIPIFAALSTITPSHKTFGLSFQLGIIMGPNYNILQTLLYGEKALNVEANKQILEFTIKYIIETKRLE